MEELKKSDITIVMAPSSRAIPPGKERENEPGRALDLEKMHKMR